MEIIDDEVEIQEDDTSPEEQNLSQLFCGALSSLWFSAPIKSFDSVKQRHDLSPEGALCLLIMVTQSVSSSTGIQIYLHPFGGGMFERHEAKVLAESGLFSLKSNGYLRLDAKGEQELKSHDHRYYGLGDVQWLLTAKAARAMAPIYCHCKKMPSHAQAQAIKDMLAANKAKVAENRKRIQTA